MRGAHTKGFSTYSTGIALIGNYINKVPGWSQRQALEELPTAQSTPTVSLAVSIPYTRFGEIKRVVHPPEVVIAAERYADTKMELTLEVAVDRLEWLREALASFGAVVTSPGD